MRFFWRVVALTLLTCTSGQSAEPDGARQPTAADIEFFEKHVRPLFLSACSECHGEKKQWGGLRVDSRSALLKGGDSSPAVIPGKPEESLLIAAVRRTGDFEMPPEKPLNPEQVAILEQWVAGGAHWPEEEGIENQKDRQQSHWAFQAVSRPVPPAMENGDWCRNPIDQFVLTKLQQAGLKPSPAADRRTLIRRISYTLTGLPPSPKEVEAFIQDPDPDADAKLIDRLLDSPQYGEHWARHWLDLARYADTRGYMFGWEPGYFVHSATYRDWVVKAFQTDLPYDRFLLLQIAADQAAPDDPGAQAAMGFLTVGRRFLGNDHDIIDDRIDVLGRTTMGLTFGCARCHDHKYDPIPTADYYSLYGVIGNSAEELVCATAVDPQDQSEFQVELRKRTTKLEEELQRARAKISERMRSRFSDYLVAQLTPEQYPNIPFSQILAETDIFPVYVERVEAYLRKAERTQDPIFQPWHLFAELKDEDFATQAPAMTQRIQENASGQIPAAVVAIFQTPPASMRDVAERYGKLFAEVHQEWISLVKQAEESKTPVPQSLPEPEREKLRAVLYAPDSPCLVPNQSLIGIGPYFSTRGELEEIWKHQRAVEQWIYDSANGVPFAVRMIDKSVIEEPRVFRRGNPMTKVNEVPRQLPVIVAGENRKPFEIGSGRLELAQGIVDPKNPLTARVWVNRLWQHHFGTGLVPTSSDFGIRAPRPEHLELLDWLASKLVEENWSTKSIQRLILLSSTWQQQSTEPEDAAVRIMAAERDPENKLFSRMNLHRLTFEEFRDSMLKVTGALDETTGGRGSPIFAGNDTNRRRTLYGFIDRQSLPDAYRVFDFANPDLHIPVRSETTVSQQALFAMNHPFIASRAVEMAARLERNHPSDLAARVEELYSQFLQRAPTSHERTLALNFIEGAEDQPQPNRPPEQLAWSYGYGAIEETANAVKNFQPLPFFNGSAWQGSNQYPDAKLGWVQLTAEGGHPGNTHDHAAVRRWTAPRSGTFTISSTATHEPTQGNGIRCWIISSRHGVLNRFLLHQSSQKIKIASHAVEAGDTLDFVADINGNLGFDQFLWSIKINEANAIAGADELNSTGAAWDSVRDFAAPESRRLSPWEQLSQVLLLSNEFLFVD